MPGDRELTMTNDEAHDWLLGLLNATPPPRNAERFGAAIRAIRAKAIADAKEWFGLDAPVVQSRLTETDYQMLWLQRVAWVAEIIEASGKAENASAAEVIAALRGAVSDSTTRGDLDADRLRRAIDNVNEMDPLDYLDEGDNVDAIAAEYVRLRSKEPTDAR